MHRSRSASSFSSDLPISRHRALTQRGASRIAAISLVALIGVGAALFWSNARMSDDAAVDPDARIVVTLFDNETGDDANDVVGKMAQDWITVGLQKVEGLRVVPSDYARQASLFAEEEREAGRVSDVRGLVAEETGADIVVSGAMRMEGSEVRLEAQIDRADGAGVIAHVDPVVGPPESLPALLGNLRRNVATALGEATNTAIAGEGLATPAPSPEAYVAFNDGLELYVSGRNGAASSQFRAAFETDTSYLVPLIYASLTLRNSGQWAASDTVTGILESRRGELTEYEQLWLAYSRAVLGGKPNEARLIMRQAAEMAPGSKAAYNWAFMANNVGRPAEALEAMSTLTPDRGAMRGVANFSDRLAATHHRLGNHELELTIAYEFRRRAGNRSTPVGRLVRAHAALGQADSVAATIRQALEQFPAERVAWWYGTGAEELWAHGYVDAAQALAARGLEWLDTVESTPDQVSVMNSSLTEDQQLQWARAWLNQVTGNLNEATALMRPLARELPDDWGAQAELGVLAAWRGDVAEAREVDAWLAGLEGDYMNGWNTRWRAMIAARRGERERALDLLEQSVEEGRYWGALHPNLHFVDVLGQEERYRQLVEPKG